MTDTASTSRAGSVRSRHLHENGIFLNDPDRRARIGFLFPGHGSQYLDMLAELIGRNRAVSEVFDEVDASYRSLTGRDLTASFVTARGGSAQQLADPEVMQPAIYAASVALYRAVSTIGLVPELMIGHSLGEYAALTAAGAISLTDGMRATHARGVAVKGLARDEWGAMVAVTVADDAQSAALQTAMLLAQTGRPATLTRSIDNAPDLVVVAGPAEVVAEFRTEGERRGLTIAPLPVTHAFHSPVLAPCVPGLGAALAELTWRAPHTTVLSSVLGRPWAEEDINHLPQLLAQQLVTPFSFVDLMSTAAAAGVDTFVEVGPKAILTALVNRRPNSTLVVLPSNVPALGAEESLSRVAAFARAEGLSADPSGPMSKLDQLRALLLRLTGYPASLVDDDTPLRTGLGVPDSVVDRLRRAPAGPETTGASGDPTLRELAGATATPPRPAPAPSTEEVVAPVVPGVPVVDRGVRVTEVVGAFAAKTGYPVELIEPDLDLEADLGIDSVKRAEVLAELFGGAGSLEGVDFSTLSSVTAIVDLLMARSPGSSEEVVAPVDPGVPVDLRLPQLPVAERYVTSPAVRTIVDADRGTGFDPAGRTILILADPSGTVAVAVRARLTSAALVVVVASAGTPSVFPSDETIDWSDLDAAAAALASLHARVGEVHAVIDLTALSEADFASGEPWTSLVDTGFASSFLTAREVYGDLQRLGSEAAYLAATRIGEVFGAAGGGETGNPVGAVQSGFVKSLSRELPEPHMKVVDFSPGSDDSAIAELIVTEMGVDIRTDDLEIGYLGGDRHIVKLIPAPLPDGRALPTWAPAPGSVVLMSGGSRGITLECAKAVAAHNDVTVVVLGRTVRPLGTEPWVQMSDEAWSEARPAIMREQRLLHPDWAPIRLAREYERLSHARTLAVTIDSFATLPGRLVYRACDVADPAAVQAAVDAIVGEYGPISTVVHGAGLESFGAVPKKPLEHSTEVVRVKARGLHNLWHATAGQPVERFVSFGSVSARGGMDGQVDYTAGCALLSAMSSVLADARPNCHVTTIDWTAWSGTGMADHPTVRKVQEIERKMVYLDITEGVRHFERELGFGCDAGEVIYAGELGSNQPRGQFSALDPTRRSVAHPIADGGGLVDAIHSPMLTTAKVQRDAGGVPVAVRADRVLSRRSDRYLDDHLVKGHATFPGVFHIEAEAEAAHLLADGRFPIETCDVHLDRFLLVRPGAEVRTWATASVIDRTAERTVIEGAMHSAFEAPNGALLDPDRVHSGATFVYGPQPPQYRYNDRHLPDLVAVAAPFDMDRYYSCASASITFGPTFRYLTKVGLHSPTELVCELETPRRPGLLSRTPMPRFLGAPLVIDNVGRAALMWALHSRGLHVVPRRIALGRVGRRIVPGERLFGHVQIVDGPAGTVTGSAPSIYCDITVTDGEDLIVCSLHGIQLETVATSPDGPHDLLR